MMNIIPSNDLTYHTCIFECFEHFSGPLDHHETFQTVSPFNIRAWSLSRLFQHFRHLSTNESSGCQVPQKSDVQILGYDMSKVAAAWKPLVKPHVCIRSFQCTTAKPTSGWTNPFEKYADVKLDHFPNFRGENKKYWKPPRKLQHTPRTHPRQSP